MLTVLPPVWSQPMRFYTRFRTDPVFQRHLNGWLAVAWLAAAVPICIYLATSVPFLVFVSVYAVVTGHWSAWQAARVEVNQQTTDDPQ